METRWQPGALPGCRGQRRRARALQLSRFLQVPQVLEGEQRVAVGGRHDAPHDLGREPRVLAGALEKFEDRLGRERVQAQLRNALQRRQLAVGVGVFWQHGLFDEQGLGTFEFIEQHASHWQRDPAMKIQREVNAIAKVITNLHDPIYHRIDCLT